MKKKPVSAMFIANSIEEQWEILEQAFHLPPEQRTAFIMKKAQEKKATLLGLTDKNVNELSIECLKKGVNAKGIGKGKDK